MTKIEPFLKCPGGKRQLLEELKKYVPPEFDMYYEPFIGGAALLLNLLPKKAVINDSNPEIINCFEAIANNALKYKELCLYHQRMHSEAYYTEVRNWDRESNYDSLPLIEKAARFQYLNKTCFNGLIRYNLSAQFNVPIGAYKNPSVISVSNIDAIARYFFESEISFYTGDFHDAVKHARYGDFCYFDPPYYELMGLNNRQKPSFNYGAKKFTADDHIRLRETCDELSDRGCYILVSNSDTEFVRKLFKDDRYTIVEVAAKRAINCDPDGRGEITELLIHNKYI